MALSEYFPLVLAPTGMVPTKQQNPFVPITPKEIVADVKACVDIGITSVHLHARNEIGEPTYEKEVYSEIIYGIREIAPHLAINVSTSGRNWSDFEKRADCLALMGDLKPDLASLTTSSLNFMTQASLNDPSMVRRLLQVMVDREITPELELFDLGMVNAVKVLQKEGLLTDPIVANLFFGNIYSAQADPIEMAALVTALPAGAIWSGAGIGSFQAISHAYSLAMGGGARTGLEDSLYLDPQSREMATNPMLVSRVHVMGGTLNRKVMPPAEFKRLLRKH